MVQMPTSCPSLLPSLSSHLQRRADLSFLSLHSFGGHRVGPARSRRSIISRYPLVIQPLSAVSSPFTSLVQPSLAEHELLKRWCTCLVFSRTAESAEIECKLHVKEKCYQPTDWESEACEGRPPSTFRLRVSSPLSHPAVPRQLSTMARTGALRKKGESGAAKNVRAALSHSLTALEDERRERKLTGLAFSVAVHYS
jgi:hypothetical protein